MSTTQVLAVHQGSEMFGSDRMFAESVLGMTAHADVTVMLPDDGPLAERLRSIGVHVHIAPVFVLRKRLLRPGGWRELISTARAGAKAIRHALRLYTPDVVYVSTITIPQVIATARRSGRRVVAHVHEVEPITNAPSQVRARILYRPLRHATRVICNSEFTRSVVTEAHADLADRIDVIPNGVAQKPPTMPRPNLAGELRITYVGRLSPRKGPDVLLDAIRELSPRVSVSVRLVGSVFSGYEWYETDLRRRVNALPPEAHVTFTGFSDDAAEHVAWSDVVVVPSRVDESFGNTAIEGVLAGRPVIASDLSALREVTHGIDTVTLVQPDNPAALAEALTGVAQSWRRVIRSTGAAAAEAERRYSPAAYRERVRAAVLGTPRPDRCARTASPALQPS